MKLSLKNTTADQLAEACALYKLSRFFMTKAIVEISNNLLFEKVDRNYMEKVFKAWWDVCSVCRLELRIEECIKLHSNDANSEEYEKLNDTWKLTSAILDGKIGSDVDFEIRKKSAEILNRTLAEMNKTFEDYNLEKKIWGE